MQEKYSIADIERLSGIKAHTVRIWEKRYGILRPARTETNIRYYSDEDLKKILRVSFLNRHGFKISLLASKSDVEINELIDGLSHQSIDAEHFHSLLLLSMTEYNEHLFNETWKDIVEQFGFEQAIISIIYPFFIRIGALWQMNSILPSNEHFFSNLVRNKIVTASSALVRVKSESIEARRAIIMGYSGDSHEIGLLFINYLFLSAGWETLYLGPNVPEADYEGLVQLSHIKSVYIHMVITPSYSDFVASIKHLMSIFRESDILIGGNFPSIAAEQIVYPGLYFIGNPQKLLHHIH